MVLPTKLGNPMLWHNDRFFSDGVSLQWILPL
jgi:hypothetical protein